MPDSTGANTKIHRQHVLRDRRDEVEQVQGEILQAMERAGYDESSGFAVRLALEEALSNAFKHGNQGDESRPVTVNFEVEPACVVISVTDDGDGFDPGSVPDPTQNENVEIPSGRGLLLMRSFMSEVEIIDPGNCVRMIYRKPSRES